MTATITDTLKNAADIRAKRPAGPRKAAKAVAAKTATTEPGQRPYILESSAFLTDLNRQRDAALSEIAALEADMLGIKERANIDLNAIRTRAEVEILSRESRAADLHKIVAMADRALAEPTPAEDAQRQIEAPTTEDVAAALEAQRQAEEGQEQ